MEAIGPMPAQHSEQMARLIAHLGEVDARIARLEERRRSGDAGPAVALNPICMPLVAA